MERKRPLRRRSSTQLPNDEHVEEGKRAKKKKRAGPGIFRLGPQSVDFSAPGLGHFAGSGSGKVRSETRSFHFGTKRAGDAPGRRAF